MHAIDGALHILLLSVDEPERPSCKLLYLISTFRTKRLWDIEQQTPSMLQTHYPLIIR